MCITALTTEHPKYRLILVSNRDEFFARPTESAKWHGRTLRPQDLAREEHGTWIGVSREGRVAVLVNYREQRGISPLSLVSRGRVPVDFLESNQEATQWAQKVTQEHQLENVGGFSLVFGDVGSKKSQMYIMSNRREGLVVAQDTLALSNSTIDNPWPKVGRLEQLFKKTMQDNENEDEEVLFRRLLDILNDTDDRIAGKSFDEAFDIIPSSVLIPPLRSKQGDYGTRTQTLIAVRRDGSCVYLERDVLTGHVKEHAFLIESKL